MPPQSVFHVPPSHIFLARGPISSFRPKKPSTQLWKSRALLMIVLWNGSYLKTSKSFVSAALHLITNLQIVTLLPEAESLLQEIYRLYTINSLFSNPEAEPIINLLDQTITDHVITLLVPGPGLNQEIITIKRYHMLIRLNLARPQSTIKIMTVPLITITIMDPWINLLTHPKTVLLTKE